MHCHNSNGNRAAPARGFVALFAMLLAAGLGAMASSAAAAPFAYVTNSNDNTVSVIDTATNTVEVATTVGFAPAGVAITPDGAHAYVVNETLSGTVSVIDTASNMVVGTPIPVGADPLGSPSPRMANTPMS